MSPGARRRQLLAALVLGWLGPAAAQARYTQGAASPDGTGRWYMGREIAGVMGWQGAGWLEREGRDREERADLLLRELRLAPGMDVADIGAGTGFHSRRIAPLVAPGLVHAVDVQPQMLRLLQEQARAAGLLNIRPVRATERTIGLQAQSVDLALLVDVYHELAFPYEVMQDLVRALRPGGRVALVEYRADDPAVPIKPLHTMSLAQIRREMAPHALEPERTSDVLPWQHLVIYRKR